MNLGEILQQLVAETSDFGLVNEDGSDNGGRVLVNFGIVKLCRHAMPPIEQHQVHVSLAQGATGFTLPGTATIEEAWLVDAYGHRFPISKKDFRESMRDHRHHCSTASTGVPRWFCRTPRAGDDVVVTSDDTPPVTSITDTEDEFILEVPTNQAYTLTGLGSRYPLELVLNTDQNWWTVNHSDLVADAAHSEWFRRKMSNIKRADEIWGGVQLELALIKARQLAAKLGGPGGSIEG